MSITSLSSAQHTMPQATSELLHSPTPQHIPPPPSSTSTTATSTDTSRQTASNAVHLIWDLDSVAFPTNSTSADVYQRLAELTAQYGLLRTFDIVCHQRSSAARLDTAVETLRSFGATAHRTQHAVDVWIVTSLLQLTINLHTAHLTAATRPVVILITSNAAIASAVSAASHSGLFAEVVLCHTSNTDQSLIHSCTLAINFDVINNSGAQSKTNFFDTLERREGEVEEEAPYSRNEMEYFAGESDTTTRPHVSTFGNDDDDDITALTQSIDQFRSLPSSPQSMTQQYAGGHISLSSIPYNTFDNPMQERVVTQSFNTSARDWEPSSSPTPHTHNHQRTNDYSDFAQFGGNGNGNGEQDFTHSQSGRASRFVSPATANSAKARKGAPMNVQSGSVHAHPQSLSAGRARTCVQAFHKVIAYCEQERIIPRESVVKKRLLDSKIGIELDFEELVLAVREYGAGVIEGEPPQRIIWPRGPNNEARKFPCVDFLTPRSRLSSDQMNELFKFLLHFQPEVDRGRFGFAQYLGRHGPIAIRQLPHGILVELVQLLLNQKVLLFRKGRVSVSPALLTDPSLLQLALSGQPTAAATAAAGVNVTTPIQSANASPMPSPPPEKEYGFASHWPGSAPSTPPGHNVRTIRPAAAAAWLNNGANTTTSAAQMQRAQQHFLNSTATAFSSMSPPPTNLAPQPLSSQPARRFGGLDPNQPAFVSMYDTATAPANEVESELSDGGESDRPNALPPLHNRVVPEWKQFVNRPRGSSLPPRPDPLNGFNNNGHHSTPSSPLPLPQSVESPIPIKYNVYRRNSTGGTTDGYSGAIHSAQSAFANGPQHYATMGAPSRPASNIPTSSSASKLSSFADTFMNAKTERVQPTMFAAPKNENTHALNELHDRLVIGIGAYAAPLYHWEVATSDDGKSYFISVCTLRLTQSDKPIIKRFQSPMNMNRSAAQSQTARNALDFVKSVVSGNQTHDAAEMERLMNSLPEDEHTVHADSVLELDRLLYGLNQPQMIYSFSTETNEKRTVVCSARLSFNQQSVGSDEHVVNLQLPAKIVSTDLSSSIQEFSAGNSVRAEAKVAVATQILSVLRDSQSVQLFVSPPPKQRTISDDSASKRNGELTIGIAKLAQSPSTQSTPLHNSDKLVSRSLPNAIASCIPSDRAVSPDSASLKLGPALLSALNPAGDDVRDNRSSNMSILSSMKAPVTPNSADAASLFTFAFQQQMNKPPTINEQTNNNQQTAEPESNSGSASANRVIGRPRSYSFD